MCTGTRARVLVIVSVGFPPEGNKVKIFNQSPREVSLAEQSAEPAAV
jgi:hypothetical protein